MSWLDLETSGIREDVRDLPARHVAQLLAAIVLARPPHRILIGGTLGGAASMLLAMPKDAGLDGALLLARGLVPPRLKEFV